MESYKAKNLPFDYIMSNEIFKLLLDAREAYGEYKGFLKNMAFDYKCFLEYALINDIYYSFKIDNKKIEKKDMFFMPYKLKSNLVTEFNNIKKMILFAITQSDKTGFSLELYNKTHKGIFANCSKDNSTKKSGTLRKIQTYILKPGLAGSAVSFIPPVYTDLNPLMKNLCEYLNTSIDDPFITMCFSHYQFEKIHPYVSGNGRLGRLMIPVHMSYYKKEPPLLFLSESIDNLKNTYFTLLSSQDDSEYDKVLKLFLQCIIVQCNNNIKKIKLLNKLYDNDYKEIVNTIGGTTILKVYPIMLKKVVFTTSDVVNECKLHINSVNKVLNKLVDSGYLIKEKRTGTNRVTFTYKNLYDLYTK